VTIPDDLISRTNKYFTTEFKNLWCVKKVLDNPLQIYSGVRQLNYGFWCYTGRPESWWIKPNVESDFPDHLVYAVYLNDRFVLYSFRAELADEKDNSHIRGWEDRFGGLKWSKNATS
jgi:hypothetical protein